MPTLTYPTVTPYLIVADADALAKFLTKAFGAVEQQVNRNDDGKIAHAELKIGESLLMLGQAGGPWKPRSAAFYLWLPDVDAAYKRALEAGATSESAPEDKPYGHRVAGVDFGSTTWWIGAEVKRG
jgi:uncharacterized glyoxalase superfamily protein PhnB